MPELRWRFVAAALLLLLPQLLLARSPATLLFAAEDDWFPYSGVQNGQPAGLAVDIVREVYARQGVKVRFQSLSYSRCMEVARTASYAGCFTTSRNDRFEPYYDYAKSPLLDGVVNIYGRINSPARDLDMKSLEGQQVGVVMTYGYGREFDRNTAIRKEYSTREINAFQKLKAGRVPYVVAWPGTVNYLLSQNPDLRGWIRPVGQLSLVPLFVSFSRAHPSVAQNVRQFDEGMQLLRKSGQLQRLEHEWGTRPG